MQERSAQDDVDLAETGAESMQEISSLHDAPVSDFSNLASTSKISHVTQTDATKLANTHLSESFAVKAEKADVDVSEALVSEIDVTADLAEKPVAKADFDRLQEHQEWLQIFDAIPFNGLLRAIAAECVLLHRQEAHLFFALDKHRAQLYNEHHAQQMADALSVFYAVTVSVSIGLEASSDELTPSQYLQGLKQQAFNKALASLESDAGVNQILQAYNAEIEKETVKSLLIEKVES
jgi:hypothetical protein